MKAHWLNDGEQVLVTGTLDPGEAVRFITEDGEEDMAEFIHGLTGYPQRGYTVPAATGTLETSGIAWWWRSAADGRCRAVVFG